MPTRDERYRLQLGDAGPVLVITRAGGAVELYPGDITQAAAVA